MKFFLQITPTAFSDIQKGIDYYNLQQRKLGTRFNSVIRNTFTDIRKMPLASSIAFDNIRYKVVGKFPYVILFAIDGNYIQILRVFNTHQKPT